MKDFERLMRGAHDGRKRRLPGDIYKQAARYSISDPARVEELYSRACHIAQLHFSFVGDVYQRLLEEASGPRPVAPCKRMRTEALYGNPHRWAAPKPGVAPTKRTRTQTRQEELAKRERFLKMRALIEEYRRNGIPLPNEVRFPHYREVMGIMAECKHRPLETQARDRAPSPAQRAFEQLFDAITDEGSNSEISGDTPAPSPTALPVKVQTSMERAFEYSFEDVVVHTDSPQASGSTRALTRGREVFFGQGEFLPGTEEGDWLIAHELAHVVQQTRPSGHAGPRQAIEADADQAANAVIAGQKAQVHLRASDAVSYAYSDAEDREPDVDFDAGSNQKIDAGTDRDLDLPDALEDDEERAQADLRAEFDALGGETITPEDGGGGGDGNSGGSGGSSATTQAKKPPRITSAHPESVFGQLKGVRPDVIAARLGQMHTAISEDVATSRAQLVANPPKQMSTGTSTGTSAGSKEPLPPAVGNEGASPGTGLAEADAAEHDALHADQQAQDSEKNRDVRDAEPEQDQQETAGQLLGGVVESIGALFNSFFGANTGQDQATTMSEDTTHQMSASLEHLNTQAEDINTQPGQAPSLDMSGETSHNTQRDQAAFEQKIGGALKNANRDIQAPMGEDVIEPSITSEELSALPLESESPDVALPPLESLASGEEVGIIAQETHQADIDAAAATAQADMSSEHEKDAQNRAQARLDADQHITDFTQQTDADSERARGEAISQVDEARDQWRAEVEKHGKEARAKADQKVQDGLQDIENTQRNAKREAKRHLETGEKKAAEAKEKGEQEAEAAKAKGKETSSGFLSWMASKARAFFDGIKNAISKALDAARKAVKTVIAAAKRLANKAIEMARKAIMTTIQTIGKALANIGDVLLAAFSGLRAKFRNAIEGFVNEAVQALNKLAEGLKNAVQKTLDLLGAALDKALHLLERGLHAIVDVYTAAVQGAIQAAQAVANALGPWLKLISHIASGPIEWLGKLGAAAMDGVKNHLWGAFKVVVVGWFQSKVLELLGIGGLVLQLLLDGGITVENISQMALQALITAIPAALITILLEKLVAMLIPAAGAVLVIIEGLQAAWGTVSRIIAAFSAFMAFLMAVQGGSAGALFAAALAAAAVVLLDFVSNWLLRKLRKPAANVGKKLKGMAQSFKGRRGHGTSRFKDKSAHPNTRTKSQKTSAQTSRADKKGKKNDAATAQRIANQAAQRAWRTAQRRTRRQLLSKAALESAIEVAAVPKQGFRITVDVVATGHSWRMRAHATKGSVSGTAHTGRGWIARADGASWFTTIDQRKKHEAIVRDADRMLDNEAREVAKKHSKLRDIHRALRPRIQKIERTLTKRLLKGIHLTIDENEFTTSKDSSGDHELLYSWEIRPNTSKKKLAASGFKKRGDHVFAHALSKLPGELRSVAGTFDLYHSKPRLLAAIDTLANNIRHNAFEITVHKPEASGNEGDAQSRTFGAALKTFRSSFAQFLSALDLFDIAVATQDDEVDMAKAEATAALTSVKTLWSSLLDSAHDTECTPHLSGQEKTLEKQGLTILSGLKISFPAELSAALATPHIKLEASSTSQGSDETKDNQNDRRSGGVPPETSTDSKELEP